MRRLSILGLIPALALAASLLPAAAMASGDQPTPPHRFFGMVGSSSGDPAPDGLLVAAVVDGIEKALCVTRGGWYGNVGTGGEPFDVHAHPGDIVFFRVQGEAMGQTCEWQAGEITRLDFTLAFDEDVTPPAMPSLQQPGNGAYINENSPLIDWADAEDDSGNPVSYRLQVDDNSDFSSLVVRASPTTSEHKPAVPLADGAYRWRVMAVDVAGNGSGWSEAWSFIVDTTGPAVSITALVPDPTGDNTPTLNGTATDDFSNILAVEYRIDGEPWMAADAADGAFDSLAEDYAFATPTLVDGLHTIEVRARDDLGNWTDAEDYGSDDFTVDTAPPTVTIDILSHHPTTPATTPTFTGTASDATTAIASVEYRILAADGTTVEIDWTAAGFAPAPSDPKLGAYSFATAALAEGWHLLEVRATDAAGNTAAAQYNPPDGFCATAGPLVRFDMDSPMTATSPMWVTAGKRTRDCTPTFQGYAASGLGAIVRVQCSIDGAWTDAIFFPNPTDPKAGTWEFTPAPLADGLHVIQVKAIDEDGEETPAEIYAEGGAGCITFTLDTRAPVITNVAASDVTPGSVVITWTTDEPASSQADYGTDTDYGSVSELDADLTTEHAVTLAGLDPKTQYHFRARSTDDVGNEAVSEDYSLSKPFAAWIYAATAIGGLVVLGIGVSAAAAVRRLLR